MNKEKSGEKRMEYKYYKTDCPKNGHSWGLDYLKANLSYPLEVFNKENGFLGLLSYDKDNKKLFISSKSTNVGEFKSYFESFVKKLQKLDEITKFLKENNVTMIFEVIDIENDPHIIKYESSKIVLLDIVSNTLINPKYYDYNELVSKANKFEIDVKIKSVSDIKDNEELDGFLANKQSNMAINDLEGYVIRDSKGFMFKIKLPYYQFWKKMRGLKEALVSNRSLENLDGEKKKVVDFMRTIDKLELANLSIIDIADMYYKNN